MKLANFAITFKKEWTIRIGLLALATSAMIGVYDFSARFHGPVWAAVTASAFELVYIGLALLPAYNSEFRRKATRISFGAVAVSILYNIVSSFFNIYPQIEHNLSIAGYLVLAILQGVPLAWIAYLIADLVLHSDENPLAKMVRALEQEREKLQETLKQEIYRGATLLAEKLQIEQERENYKASWNEFSDRFHEEKTARQALQKLLEQEQEQFTKLLLEAGQESANYKAKFEQLQAEYNTLQFDFEESKDEKSNCEELQSELEKLQREQEHSTGIITRLQNKLNDALQAPAQLQKELAKYPPIVEQLKKDLDGALADLEQEQFKTMSLEEIVIKLKSLESLVIEAGGDLQSRKYKIGDYRNRIKELFESV